MGGVKTITVREDEDGMRLDRWFKARLPDMPFGRLQKALRKGEVRLDGARAKADSRVTAGQSVRVPPYDPKDTAAPQKRSRDASKPGGMKARPGDAAFAQGMVVFRNQDVLAIDKPAGLAVQGGQGTERHLDGLLDHLTFDAAERPRLVHRLDKDTSGVMLLARNRKAASALADAFKRRETRKIYWAITVGVPKPEKGTIDLALAKGGPAGKERVHAAPEDGKNAITDYAVLDHAAKRAALVALWPRTGRTHQLRAHLAAIDTPILGDGKYGGRAAFIEGEETAKGLHLHARELVLPPGVKGAGAKITAPPPKSFQETLALFEFETNGRDDDPFEEIA